jgi:hypothetical protein
VESLEDFISRRRRELAAQAGQLRDQLHVLEAEIDQLDRAAKAAGIPPFDPAAAHDIDYVTPHLSERTIKAAVLAVLNEVGRGMTALEILAAINSRFNSSYARTSLSPQLSRLKQQGSIERDGIVWSLGKPKEIGPAHPRSEGADAQEQRVTVEPGQGGGT